MKACSKCGVKKDDSAFQLYKGRPMGQCRSCKTEAMKRHRAAHGIEVRKFARVTDGEKECLKCDRVLSLEEFSPTPRGTGGVASYCKTCMSAYQRKRGGQAAYTAAYRARHPERHKANHRLRMWEYRSRKKATDDGTVTDEILRFLYGQSHCHYCEQDIADDDRTIDHKTPLARGGAHSASNLVMACFTCNSSKRDLTEEEFKERTKKDGTVSSDSHC